MNQAIYSTNVNCWWIRKPSEDDLLITYSVEKTAYIALNAIYTQLTTDEWTLTEDVV